MTNTSVFTTMGATSHSTGERQAEDYYATDPIAAEFLLEELDISNILEPSCGEGHLAKVFEDDGIKVTSSDLIDRGYGKGGIDFLKDYNEWDGDIVTNPPYKIAKEFVEHALDIIPDGRYVVMFLKIQFLESKGRKQFFLDNPPLKILVSSSRINCAKNGDFHKYKSSAVCYAWYIWQKGYEGSTTIEWIN